MHISTLIIIHFTIKHPSLLPVSQGQTTVATSQSRMITSILQRKLYFRQIFFYYDIPRLVGTTLSVSAINLFFPYSFNFHCGLRQ